MISATRASPAHVVGGGYAIEKEGQRERERVDQGEKAEREIIYRLG